jgi:hypothetical protein
MEPARQAVGNLLERGLDASRLADTDDLFRRGEQQAAATGGEAVVEKNVRQIGHKKRRPEVAYASSIEDMGLSWVEIEAP